VTDPEDDTLVIWGIVREGEPPKQLVAGGEFFVLKKVARVEKVGDVLGIDLVPEGREPTISHH
jgi:cytochrome c oxidase subunit 5b